MVLFYLEARKGLWRGCLLAAVLLLLGINAIKIWIDYRTGALRDLTVNTTGMQEAFDTIYTRVKGPVTVDKVQYTVSEDQRLEAVISDGTYSRERQQDTYSGYYFGDYYMMHHYFYNPMKYCVEYPSDMEAVISQVKENIEFYRRHFNQELLVKNQYLLKHYQNRYIPAFYHYDGWKALFRYQFSNLLILLLLILGLAPCYTREKETGMEIHLCRGSGRLWKVTVSKCLTAAGCAALLTLLFAAENYLLIKVLCGLEGGANPLYAISEYRDTPFGGSIMSFYIRCTCFGIFSFMTVSIFLLCLSALMKKTLAAFISGIATILVLEYLSGFAVSKVPWKVTASMFSPLTLYRAADLYKKPYGSSLFGGYFLRLDICLAVQLLYVVLLLIWLWAVGRKLCCGQN